jgi:hypothetical protein
MYNVLVCQKVFTVYLFCRYCINEVVSEVYFMFFVHTNFHEYCYLAVTFHTVVIRYYTYI